MAASDAVVKGGPTSFGLLQVESVQYRAPEPEKKEYARINVVWDEFAGAPGGVARHLRRWATLVSFGPVARAMSTLKPGELIYLKSGVPQAGRPYESKGEPGVWKAPLEFRVEQWSRIDRPVPPVDVAEAEPGPTEEEEYGHPFA